VKTARVGLAFVFAAAFVAPSTNVFAQDQNVAPVPMTAAPAHDDVPNARIDKDFIAAAAASGESEIAQAQLAIAHSHNDSILGFARTMIVEHTTIAKELAAIRGVGPSVKAPLPASDQIALDNLKTEKLPEDFDDDYAMQQVGGHLVALTAFQTEARNGANRKLKDFAKKWLPTIKAHLQMAIGLTKHGVGDTPFKS
jgi:putative membrane protein